MIIIHAKTPKKKCHTNFIIKIHLETGFQFTISSVALNFIKALALFIIIYFDELTHQHFHFYFGPILKVIAEQKKKINKNYAEIFGPRAKNVSQHTKFQLNVAI